MTFAPINDSVPGADCLLDQYGAQAIATFLKRLLFSSYITHVEEKHLQIIKQSQLKNTATTDQMSEQSNHVA
jgi:hypothetical protein